ncbi:arginine--tRNA ligase [Patescibacteria group bacterium]|nr:arginine--tRNA ligase [Patescibacteria group bacterium]
MKKLKEQLAAELSKIFGMIISVEDLLKTPSLELGDIAFNISGIAQTKKKNLLLVRDEYSSGLTNLMNKIPEIESIQTHGAYINFYIKDEYFAKSVFETEMKQPAKSLTESELTADIPEKIMIEYSQPNTHKEFHIGHLRNACLGAALVNINRALGKKVVAANYIGDSGVHIAKCLWNLTKFHSGDTIPENKGEYLGALYSEAAQRLEIDEEGRAEVSQIQKELAENNPESEMVKLWIETKDWSMESFMRIYDLLKIKFDVWFWESREEIEGRKLIEKILQEKTIPEIKKSEGAIIADLSEYGLDVLVLVKSDGNVLYGTKDLPLGMKKFDEYKVDKSIYVVDKRQSLYLKQIFKLLDLLGYDKKEKVHVPYDFVTLPEGAMASRKGNVIAFEKFFAEIMKQTTEETEKRHADWSAEKVRETAEKIALAALKFSMLKYDNNSVIVFDVKKALALEGDTGPYILYSIARINSILRQIEESSSERKIDYSLLKTKAEKKLIRQLAKFAEVVENSAEENAPSKICTYLLEVGQYFNTFYHECPILKEEENLKQARLALAEKTKKILESGLDLLNIEQVKEM